MESSKPASFLLFGDNMELRLQPMGVKQGDFVGTRSLRRKQLYCWNFRFNPLQHLTLFSDHRDCSVLTLPTLHRMVNQITLVDMDVRSFFDEFLCLVEIYVLRPLWYVAHSYRNTWLDSQALGAWFIMRGNILLTSFLVDNCLLNVFVLLSLWLNEDTV